ncbi:phage tail sheath protein, partial [Flavonifractor sp. An52]
MSMTIHERPGVYSSYDASTVISGSGGSSTVGLVGLVSEGESGKLYTLNRYEDAVTQFGQEENLTKLVQILFRNGAAKVVAVPVSGEEDYQGAFDLLAAEEDISVVVCDSTQLTVQQALRQSVCDASQARRERIAVVGGAQNENVEALVQRAEGLNSERVVLVAPGDDTGLAAAAVAGAIAGESDPAIPLGGAELRGLEGMEARYADTEID